MKMILRAFLLFVFLCALSGICAAQNQPPVDKPVEPATSVSVPEAKSSVEKPSGDKSAKALVYFYRLKALVGWALEPLILCDGKEIAKMDNGSYFAVSLEPGTHTCNISNNKSGFEADFKPGESRYAKVTLEAGAWKGHGVITLVQPEQASYEIKNLKLLKASKIKDPDSVTLFEGSKQ